MDAITANLSSFTGFSVERLVGAAKSIETDEVLSHFTSITKTAQSVNSDDVYQAVESLKIKHGSTTPLVYSKAIDILMVAASIIARQPCDSPSTLDGRLAKSVIGCRNNENAAFSLFNWGFISQRQF